MLETWNAEPWNLGVTSATSRISESLEPWKLETLQPWNLEPWNPGTLQTLETYIESWNPGTLQLPDTAGHSQTGKPPHFEAKPASPMPDPAGDSRTQLDRQATP